VMFSVDVNQFAMFHILFEFTQTNAINPVYEITMVDHKYITWTTMQDNILVLLAVFTAGLILQKLTEFFYTCVKAFNKTIKKEVTPIMSTPEIIQKSPHIFFESTFESIVQYFGHNPWNIVDTIVNTCVFVYIILLLMTQITSSPYAIQNPMDLDIRHLWNLETLSQISKVFVSVGVVLAFLRFLNFFLPVHFIGPLILSMLRMYQPIGYFILLLCVILLGFSGAFCLMYGGYQIEYSS